MLLLVCCQLRPRTSEADDTACCTNGSNAHTPSLSMKRLRPACSCPHVSFFTPTYARRDQSRPPPVVPFMICTAVSRLKIAALPPPRSSVPLRPNMLVPQSPPSALQRLSLPPLPFAM